MSPSSLTATYRLQLTPRFTLADARAAVPYLAGLGVSHVYLSPLLVPRRGSTHGYDVVDHSRMNPELGDVAALRSLADALHAHDMGVVLDIVPNHAAATIENPAWADVLAHGRASRFASWFDIDWDAPRARGRLVLPVLGDDLDTVVSRGEIRVDAGAGEPRIAYFEKRFPIGPQPVDPARASRPAELRALLEAQHYRLTSYRNVRDVNYRRFFDVADLVALRMEDAAVFDAVHALVLGWVRDGIVDGVRVDHIDGLASPGAYLRRLRAALDAARAQSVRRDGERALVFVEKILGAGEALPEDWPVDGTTGYEFLNDVEDLFLDPAGYASIEAFYRALRRNPDLRFRDIARDAKRQVLRDALSPDVARLARLAHAWRRTVSVEAATAAIIEVIACLDVYRTYVTTPGDVRAADAHALRTAFAAAREAELEPKALALLRDAFFAAPPTSPDPARAELVTRFQQTSGPAAAKGVEDTALYVYVPLVARNEVGGAPDAPLADAPGRLHSHNTERARAWPRSLLSSTTHDTKRSADVRSRLSALSAHPVEWERYVARWRRLNRRRKSVVGGRPAPDTRTEYLFYQTLLGIWPVEKRGRRLDDLPLESWLADARERLTAYMLKAAREAKTRTSWTRRDGEYEAALEAFVGATLQGDPDDPFLADVARLAALTHDDGSANALARIAIQCTAPGTPDVYQGDERWNFALVDPDNRRPVGFAAHATLLGEAGDHRAVLRDAFQGRRPLADDAVKVAVTAALLGFRRAHPQLLREGEYVPLATRPVDAAFVFARRSRDETCVTLVRARPVSARSGPVTLAVPRELGGEWESVLTGETRLLPAGPWEAIADVSELIAMSCPCDVLYRRDHS